MKPNKFSIHIQPHYETSKKEEEKEFQSPLEKPKRKIKDKKDKVIFYG